MTAQILTNIRFNFLDPDDGAPLAGGKVYFYEVGTSTPKTTWKTEDKATENTNPVILNPAGYADICLDGSYKVVVADWQDVVIDTVEEVTSLSQWYLENGYSDTDTQTFLDSTGISEKVNNSAGHENKAAVIALGSDFNVGDTLRINSIDGENHQWQWVESSDHADTGTDYCGKFILISGDAGWERKGVVYDTPEMYGDCSGVDDNDAVQAMLAAAADVNAYIQLSKQGGYYTQDVLIDDNIEGINVIGDSGFISMLGTDIAVTFESPGTNNFYIHGSLDIDCDSKAKYGFRLFGGRHIIGEIAVKNAVLDNHVIESASGHGIYYNDMRLVSDYAGRRGVVSRNLDGIYKNSVGAVLWDPSDTETDYDDLRAIIDAETEHTNFWEGGSARCTSSVFKIYSKYSNSYGVDLDYFQNKLFLHLERNKDWGSVVRNTRSIDIIGGYSEHNRDYLAQGYELGSADEIAWTDAGNTDSIITCLPIDADGNFLAAGVKIQGGRFIPGDAGISDDMYARNGFEFNSSNYVSYSESSHTYGTNLTVEGAAIFNGDARIGGALKGTIQESNVDLNAGTAYEVGAREELGEDKVYMMSVTTDARPTALALVNATGVTGAVYANKIEVIKYEAGGVIGSDEDIIISVGVSNELLIENTSAIDRTINYSLLPLM